MPEPTPLQTSDLEIERIVGQITGKQPGPMVIVTVAIHGNEPTGVIAAKRLLAQLEGRESEVNGDLIVVVGNLPAFRECSRFVDDDLNRHWTPARIDALIENPEGRSIEDGQRIELVGVISRLLKEARGTVHFVDLHTSSAQGAPFLTVGDTLRNRKFALCLPVPIMLGLEEQVDGSLLEYLNNYGFVTLGVEGGQHDAASSADRHEAVLWLALSAAGLIDESVVPDPAGKRLRLTSAAAGVPPVLEVRSRHVIRLGDDFQMEPGFTNFDPIRRGQLLARDKNGPIHAPESGRILLPLYQGKGDDGFFIAREFSTFWLLASRWLRNLSLSGLLRFLPGVRSHAGKAEVLVINTRIARIYPLAFFHLLGYRKLRTFGAALVVSRRAYDLYPPAQIRLRS